MSRITLAPNASGTGTLTVAAPNTNTDRTITLPDLTGTAVVNQGSGAFVIDSNGNVGIGTSSPTSPLTLYKNSATSVAVNIGNSINTWLSGVDSSGNFSFYTNGAYSTYFSTSGTERMRIDASGNMGIGTNNPQRRLDVSSSSSSMARFFGNNANNYIEFSDNNGSAAATIGSVGGGNIYTYSAGYNAMYAGGAERMRIDSSGVVTINNLSGAGSRTVTAGATGVLAAASDSRLKQEVPEAPIAGLAEIMQLRPVAYKWLDDIENRGDDAAVELGFFANEAKDIIPSAAPMGNDGYYGFYDRAVIAALTKAVQEQQQMIQALQADIAALKGV